MKNLKLIMGMLAIACLLGLSSCFGPDCGPRSIRVKSFTWDETLYYAKYNAAGKLIRLNASERAIVFFYDESSKLYRADIGINGQSVPVHRYEFTHGAWGITEIRTYDREDFGDGQLHLTYIQKFNYITATKFSSVIQQEVYFDEDDSLIVGFEQDRKFVYNGHNVKRIYVEPPFNEYSASSYDTKVNPFTMLAASVGNPAFFPVGRFVNYPVVDYNIPLVSIFSKNNPLVAKYEIVGAPIITSYQTFTNTYDHDLVKTIVWTSTNAPVDSRTFKFEYEWGPAL